MKRRARLRMIVYPGVPQATRRELLHFAAWLRQSGILEHDMVIRVPDAEVLKHRDGSACFGCFLFPRQRPHRFRGWMLIYVAAQIPRVIGNDWRSRGERPTRRQRLNELLRILAHEVGHYTEWRDGLQDDERRAERRGTAIVNSFLEWRRSRYRVLSPDVRPRGGRGLKAGTVLTRAA